MENFFDFHCHPTLKAGLTKKDATGTDGWSNIELDRSQLLKNLLGSQAHFGILKKGKFKLVIANLHAVEQGFAKNLLFEYFIEWLIDSHLDTEFLDSVEENRQSYYDTLKRDYEFLTTRNTTDPQKQFNIVQSASDIHDNELNVVLAVEGGHCFDPYSTTNKFPKFEFQAENEYVKNFQEFKQGKRIFSLTLTHLTPSRTSTHASGVRFLGGVAGGRNFKPGGTGITKIGKALLKECYEPANGGYKVLVDIKHMSMSAREQFYQMRKDNGWENFPIIGTHMGVSGVREYVIYGVKKPFWNSGDGHPAIPVCTYSKAGFSYKDAHGRKYQTMFNPWTISLYDKDIIEILNSGGLIGVSLDKRIVGYGEIFNEFFSKDEFDDYVKPKIDQPSDDVIGIDFAVGTQENNADVSPLMEERSKMLRDLAHQTPHIYFLANNILHIIRVGLQNNIADVWSHVCIGSDLDGLIEPICKSNIAAGEINTDIYTAADYDQLATDLTEALRSLIESHGGMAAFGVPDNNINRAVAMLMSENGLNFVSTWLAKLESNAGSVAPA